MWLKGLGRIPILGERRSEAQKNVMPPQLAMNLDLMNPIGVGGIQSTAISHHINLLTTESPPPTQHLDILESNNLVIMKDSVAFCLRYAAPGRVVIFRCAVINLRLIEKNNLSS